MAAGESNLASGGDSPNDVFCSAGQRRASLAYIGRMQYDFFDPQGEVTIYYRRLPHWDQPGVMCFITWRTIDSIPAEVLRRWRVERAVWLRQHRIDPQAANWREQLKML